MANANKLTLFIVIFMLAGILSGAVIHSYAAPGVVTAWADNITLLTDIFLRLIKMVIAPLVFSTLTVGIMRLGETSTIGRVGGKARSGLSALPYCLFWSVCLWFLLSNPEAA